MRTAARWVTMFLTFSMRLLALCLVGCLLVPAGAMAQERSAVSESAASLGDSLVDPGVEALVGGGRLAAVEARRDSPEAVAERAVSRTRFEGLGRGEAVSLAEKTFGIDHPSWTPPGSGGEGPLTKYLGEYSAVQSSPSGRHLLVTSSVPLRSAVGSGKFAPTSLALQEHDGVFVPANPVVPISISKSPGAGVALPWGISVAPSAAAAPEAPVVVGEQVFYPGTATDTDFMVAPTPGGAEASWQLLSQASPQENNLRFDLPAGIKLQMSKKDPGGAELVREGGTLVVIPRAYATEADGSELPVSYSVSGDTLATHVDLEGSVAFPVIVDPVIDGNYGALGDSEEWYGWEHWSECGCFDFFEENTRLVVSANPGSPSGAYGIWHLDAQGADLPGGSRIAHVNVSGLGHYTGTNESELYAGYAGDEGTNEGWTYNPFVGIEEEGPLETEEGFEGRSASFCAQDAGGHEGSDPALCEEKIGAQDFDLADTIGPEPQAYYTNVEISGASVAYQDTTPPSAVHMQQPGGGSMPWGWVKYGPTAEVLAHDEGVGIATLSVETPRGYENSKGEPFFSEEMCTSTIKFGVCRESVTSKPINLEALETGKHEIGVYAFDAVGNGREEEVGSKNEEDQGTKKFLTLYIDHTPPTMSAFGGSLAEATGGVIGGGDYTLSFGAEDGSTAHPQSGVRLLTVSVDGSKVDDVVTSCPEPSGIPTSSCFGLSGSWTMEGQKYGAGTHTITVTAEDWAGNEESKSMTVTVNEAAYQPVGPGSVNLRTGAFKLEATDASVASANGDLTVGRTYNSRALTAGANGPLGPQWSLSLPDLPAGGVWQSLRAMPNGSVEATTTSDAAVTFLKSGSGFASPAGYQTLTLSVYKSSPLEYEIANAAGDATIFKRAGSVEEEAPLFSPTAVVQAAGAGGLDKMTYVFTRTAEGITEPTEVIAPYPSSISCLTELVKGCRALELKYATATTAEGESESQWKNYKGRLEEIKLVAWNGKEMQKVAVATYAWDSKGRLRAEWNPQISPVLKTIYGYDSEGHVTALTPPGQETWAFTYGTTTSDATTGRLLKATLAPSSAALWAGESTANTEKPVLSGSADVGVRMAVSQGKWSGSPVAYSYLWEDCNTSGTECTPILGAENPNYTPTTNDVGHKLVAVVTATNGAGSVTAATAASAVVAKSSGTEAAQVSPGPGTTVEYNVPLTVSGRQSMSKEEVAKWGQGPDVPAEASAIFPADEPEGWPASDYRRATLFYLDANENTVNLANPAGGITTMEHESHDNVIRTLSADNRAAALKEGTKSAEAAKPLYGEDKYIAEGTELGETLGPEHKVKLPSGSEVQARKQVKYIYNEEGAPAGGPYRLATTTTEDALTSGKEEDSRTVTNSYSGQEGLGWKLHEPTSTAVAPGTLNLVHSTLYSTTTGAETETAMPGAAAKEPGGLGYLRHFGTEGETIYAPSGEAIDAHGNLWVADADWGRIDEYSSSGTFIKAFGSWGSGSDQFETPRGVAINPTTKNIYVGDEDSSRVVELNEKGEFVRAFGFGVSNGESKLQTCTTSCKIGIPGSAAGQFTEPQGIAIDSSGNLWITDFTDNRVDEYTEKGEFIAAFGFGVSNGESKLQTCTTTCKSGLAGSSPSEFYGPSYLAFSGGYLYVTDYGNDRVEKFNTSKEYVSEFGAKGSGNGQLIEPSGITAGAGGNLYIADYGNNRVQELTSSGTYVAQFGTAGAGEDELKGPEDIAITSSEDMYVTDALNKRVDEWAPSLSGNSGAYTSQTIYYTPKTEASVVACQNHPEWANMPCQTQPAHQPEVAEMPALPVTTFTYNMYFEPEVTKSTSGEGSEAPTRTETDSYDAAGRPKSKETTSSTGTVLPKVSYAYSTTTGLPIKQNTGSGSGEQKITEEYNNAGQLTSYTDAAGKTTTYEYEKEKDERLLKVTDEKGNQTLGYNETTGETTSLKDSGAGTFTASFDAEENIANETMPNGLTATITRNSVGEPVGLEYVKETHCTESCKWYSDDIVPSIHGQWVTQTSTLASDKYAYNEPGWLTQAQETPAGGKCETRLYAYNADGDRTTLTKRAPTAEGTCAKEGGEVQEHHYDTADRLLDAGIAYNPFGDTTTMAGNDAGGSELKSTFYTDGQLASQEQAGETIGYTLDPARRTSETISTGHTTATVTDQYDGPGTTPAWLAYITGEWARNIYGISGSLDATQNDTETPVLQISNLHGDTIGTMPDSETAKITFSSEATEYGVPTVTEPPPHSWLGASALRTELPSGVLDIGARSYVPQLGAFLQPDPQPGGSANAYAYTHGDPLNESDPSGEWTLNKTSGGLSAVGGEGEGTALPGFENGVGIAAGAIIPNPPDIQAQEALASHLALDQLTAATEEVAEFELPEWLEEEAGDGGPGDMHFLTYPDDKSPDVESQCNKTGQGCSGKKGGGPSGHGHVSAKDAVCTVAGAAGGAAGGVVGAIGAGGLCVLIWP